MFVTMVILTTTLTLVMNIRCPFLVCRDAAVRRQAAARLCGVQRQQPAEQAIAAHERAPETQRFSVVVAGLTHRQEAVLAHAGARG